MLHEIIPAAQLSPCLAQLGSKAELVSYCRPKNGTIAGKAGRWAVIICPGGGYRMIADTEGEPVALQFLAAGMQAFVLRYSVLPAVYPQQLFELAAAVAYLRSHAQVYGIDRIAVCGFSAGGHLAGCLANLWNDPVLNGLRGDLTGWRPDAAILSYGVISRADHPDLFDLLRAPRQASLELSVTRANPPTFLWCTCTDQVVGAENTLRYAAALHRADVKFELHIFPSGPHAMSTATPESAFGGSYINDHIANWLPLCREWLTKEV